MKYSLESRFEKLARLLGRHYGVRVEFDGGGARTDGQTIFLPIIQEPTEELIQDMHGYLDHEVAHIKFTAFEEIKNCISQFHQFLLNGAEDVRIERLMKEEFPGSIYNLEVLHEKLRAKNEANWKNLPWPVRFIFSVMYIMEGRAVVEDKEIHNHLVACEKEISQLNSATSTKELLEITRVIAEKLKQDRKEEKDQAKEGKGQKGEKSKEKSSAPTSSSQKGQKGKKEESEASSKGDAGEKGQEKQDVSPATSKNKEKDDKMLEESYGEGEKAENKFEDSEMSVHELVNNQIAEIIKEEVGKARKLNYTYHNKNSTSLSIASTNKCDEVTDYSGKSSGGRYASYRSSVMHYVNPLRTNLEKIFKSVENARWKGEREQGKIDVRSLPKLMTTPNFRTAFKEQTKTETDKVAVSILIDQSGSMGGEKIVTARLTAIAMSEALKGLGIQFEVLGFTTNSRRIGDVAEGKERFNRLEGLELSVFKSFDCLSLEGLSNIYSGGSNHDGESVWWAAKRLEQRKEKRKVLIVLSDGQPAGYVNNPDLLQSDLRRRLELIEQSGIEAIGIGILTDCVKHFYKNHVVVNTLEDLTSRAMQTISKILLKNIKTR